jgi:S-adenosylmethionine:tRNA ribosyltransferase-isomerase
MEPEFFIFPEECAQAVDETRRHGGRVISVGTTCCRVLETVARSEKLAPASGWTDLYIRPPFQFRLVDALITNFHLPRSTLLVLVSAFAGLQVVLRAYSQAIADGYRFYSYGDAMFIQD